MLAPIIAVVVSTFVLPSFGCRPVPGFKMTFYGFPDNDPPGNGTSIKCPDRDHAASGDGSFQNPLTMAAAEGAFPDCEVAYSPYLKKYLRLEDTCANCQGNWVDVWIGSSIEDGGDPQKQCENSLTGSDNGKHAIIFSPPPNLEVNRKNII
jgi:hypothetical protein